MAAVLVVLVAVLNNLSAKSPAVSTLKFNVLIEIGVGGKVEIKGFGTKADEDYNVNDKITYISTDTNKVAIDENGVITGIVKGDTEIIVMANGKQISKFTVSVGDGTYSIIEPSDEKYAFNYTYSNYINSSSDADMDSHYEYKLSLIHISEPTRPY